MVQGRLTACLLVGLAALVPAWAQAQESGDDPREAVVEFIRAVESADAAALSARIWASPLSPAQKTGRAVLIQVIVGEKALEQAARARFGVEGQRLACGVALRLSPAERSALASARILVREEGRQVELVHKGSGSPIHLRRAGLGPWQVVLEWIDPGLDDSGAAQQRRFESRSAIRLDHLRELAQILQATRQGIESGQYSDAVAADAELTGRLIDLNARTLARRRAVAEHRFFADPN